MPVLPVMPDLIDIAVMPDLIGHQEKEIPGQAGDDKGAAGDDKEDVGG